ncbi:MAG: sugar kinase [Planctomycetaceae bacterium]
MSGKQFDCLCAGLIVADTVCRPVPRLPEPGSMELTEEIELTIGGCAANVATDLARLGHSAAITGAIGTDIYGRVVHNMMSDEGVNCDWLMESPDMQTAATMIVNIGNEDRRFLHVLGANMAFTGREITPDMLAQTRILSLGGYGLCEPLTVENVKALFEQARELNVMTLLDVVLGKPIDFQKQVAPLLPLTDFFLPNRDEARLLSGLDDPFEQADFFRRAGANAVIVTCGEQGAVLRSTEMNVRCPVYPVNAVDNTGGGDAFVAGFIHGLLQNADWTTCLQMGSALGAMCVQSAGATTGIPSATELEAFVRTNRLELIEH